MKGIKLPSLRNGLPYPQEKFVVLIYSSLRGHEGQSATEVLYQLKIPMKTSAIEPATILVVAQCEPYTGLMLFASGLETGFWYQAP